MIVVWRVVNSCNLACGFCAYDKRLGFPRSQAAPAEILRFATVLAEHQAQTGDGVLLSWLGGEPLRWQPLQALTHAVRGLGLEVSATTNGTTVGSLALRQHLCETYKELTISVDGFAAFHDPSRGWAGGFEKLRRWVPQLAREARVHGSRLKLRANVVLMHQNVGEFATLCDELADWGIVEITYNQLGGRDRPEFYPQHRLTGADVDALERALPAIRQNLASRAVMLIGGEHYLARIRASTLGQRMPVSDCDPGQSFLFIDEKGQVSPFSFTTQDYGIDIGSLRSAADLAALPARFRLLQQAARSRECDDCLSTQVCGKFNAARRKAPAMAAAE
jgi:MoaA/NifB/PqqE/SkfB family radical SAM enzyme